MNEPTTPDRESTWPRRYPLQVDLDVDAHSRAQQRLRESLISQVWYQQQDKCFGMDFWRELLWLILTDPPTKTYEPADGAGPNPTDGSRLGALAAGCAHAG